MAMIYRPFIADADSPPRHASGMYRDAPRHHAHAPKPLHPLVEKLYLAAVCIGLPVFFVIGAWHEIYARILRSLAPQPLSGPELDALSRRISRDFPVRLVSYTDEAYTMASGCEELGCLIVLTFRNGDVVSFDAFASGALARQARLYAQAGGATIKEHIIAPDGLTIVLGLPATLLESLLIALFSKVIALVFAGVVLWTLIVLIAVQWITAPKR